MMRHPAGKRILAKIQSKCAFSLAEIDGHGFAIFTLFLLHLLSWYVMAIKGFRLWLYKEDLPAISLEKFNLVLFSDTIFRKAHSDWLGAIQKVLSLAREIDQMITKCDVEGGV